MDRPQRKHSRLKHYDYSQPGFYYVTIHLAEGAPCLSKIELDPKRVIRLSGLGKLAWRHLHALEDRFCHVHIDKYVIMPTHIHMIIELTSTGASLMDVCGAYKSLVTREYNAQMKTPGKKIFQSSFYETVLRNDIAYRECWRYIDENPLKWMLDPEER